MTTLWGLPIPSAVNSSWQHHSIGAVSVQASPGSLAFYHSRHEIRLQNLRLNSA